MTFYKILAAVLNDRARIQALPDSSLWALTTGEPVGKKIPEKAALRIARLQTLILREGKAAVSSVADSVFGVRRSDAELLQRISTARRKMGDKNAEKTARIRMLERLIVEAVRDEIPEECDQYRVRYCVNDKGELLRSPDPNATAEHI